MACFVPKQKDLIMNKSTVKSFFTLLCFSAVFAAVAGSLVGLGSVFTVLMTGLFLVSGLAAFVVDPSSFRDEFRRFEDSSEFDPEQMVRR